ncbi:NUDIX domain-containing protein [Micromonospora aurantiaca]|uniref:NUDIX hydrolase n=1 Tax=Micromonospora aurantiaca (nom. illeg.) TaxID=47850 RepID=UPI0033A77CF5
MDELVALYASGDLAGRVSGVATRHEVRSANLPHAATAVLLRDTSGRIYVHRRTTTKDLYPGLHDAFAGGVVGAGEDPFDTAARELREELSVTGCDLRECLRYWYHDEHASYLAYVFDATYDAERCTPVVHQPEEVAEGWWMDQEELVARLADPTWPFVPDGRESLRRYFEWAGGQG